ncbi:MAG TPA: SEC-C domain-containing protein [Dehalococcoidia bacterium]|nr:SEC-C domain-containing protein [Dehalococcoidia bacterium]
MGKIPRNAKCPCGSGLKYKKCHGDPIKQALVEDAARKIMEVLIAEEIQKIYKEKTDGKTKESKV